MTFEPSPRLHPFFGGSIPVVLGLPLVFILDLSIILFLNSTKRHLLQARTLLCASSIIVSACVASLSTKPSNIRPQLQNALPSRAFLPRDVRSTTTSPCLFSERISSVVQILYSSVIWLRVGRLSDLLLPGIAPDGKTASLDVALSQHESPLSAELSVRLRFVGKSYSLFSQGLARQ